MTSPALTALLEAAVTSAHPEVRVAGRHKVAILEDVLDLHGWPAVVALGARLRQLHQHPIVRALVAFSDPVDVIERWRRLERFGHARNRLEVVDRPSPDSIRLRHVALDGGAIEPVNDLFVWGMVIALLEEAGVRDVCAHFATPGESVLFHTAQGARPEAVLPERTHEVIVAWHRASATRPTTEATVDRTNDDVLPARLRAFLQRDLVTSWTAARAARGLGQSVRGMQRALQADGTNFSAELQRARVQAAQELLRDGRLSLTEIAFCTGFADQAHFTRTFRRHVDVPPSALRELLLAQKRCSNPGGRP